MRTHTRPALTLAPALAIACTLLSSAAAIAGDPPAKAPPTPTPAPAPAPGAIPQPQPVPVAVPDPTARPAEPEGVDRLVIEAKDLRPLIKSDLAKFFLDPVAALPRIEPRKLYVNKETRAWYTAAERDALPEADKAKLTERPLDYYLTRYGTPLAYARPLDLLATHDESNELGITFSALRIADYGYGAIGHLRLLAMNGAACTGIDTDPSLAKLYNQPGDTGSIDAWRPKNTPSAVKLPGGSIRLLTGRFPVDPGCTPDAAMDGNKPGFDLFISKNTLKNGYIHPAQPVDKRMLVDLGTTEPEFLKAVFTVLRPGGYFLIYNICPAPAKPGEKYIPWADGTCPFTKEQWQAAGFKVLVFDEKDDEAVRAMARALGWDRDGMDVEHDLFAWWTLAQKPIE